MQAPEPLEEALRTFLCNELGLESQQLARDSELVTSGLIDSADLVLLATFLERRAGISIPDQDINADHFDTIEKILGYVEERR